MKRWKLQSYYVALIVFFMIDIGKSDAICNVDGKVYRAGQFFNPSSNSKLMCVCLDGYTGIIWTRNENVYDKVIGICCIIQKSNLFMFCFRWKYRALLPRNEARSLLSYVRGRCWQSSWQIYTYLVHACKFYLSNTFLQIP